MSSRGTRCEVMAESIIDAPALRMLRFPLSKVGLDVIDRDRFGFTGSSHGRQEMVSRRVIQNITEQDIREDEAQRDSGWWGDVYFI